MNNSLDLIALKVGTILKYIYDGEESIYEVVNLKPLQVHLIDCPKRLRRFLGQIYDQGSLEILPKYSWVRSATIISPQ